MYYSDAIANGNTTSARDLMAALRTQLVNAGFTLIETYQTTSGTGNPSADVYKSPAASNAQGADWYLILRRASDTATYIQMQIAEAYDSSLHRATFYGWGGNGAAVTFPAVTTNANGQNSGAALAPDNSVLFSGNGLTTTSSLIATATTGFNWYLSATPDRVMVGIRPTSGLSTSFYAGLYDDLLPAGTIGMPLVMATLHYNANAVSAGSFTRDTPSTAFAAGGATGGLGAAVGMSTGVTYTPLTTSAALYNNVYTVSRTPVWSTRSSALFSGDVLRGLLKDTVHSYVGGSIGDTTTFNGKTYIKIGAFQSSGSDFGSIFVDSTV